MSSALSLLLALVVLGVGFVGVGIFLVFGLGWALISAGAAFLLAALFLRRGITPADFGPVLPDVADVHSP